MKSAVRTVAVLTLWMLFIPAFAQTDALLGGLEAYSRNDWPAAVLFFRKAASSPETATADAWYWLIMSEMSGGWYEAALKDADSFILRYPASARYPDVLYQRGRALYQLHRREESITQLSDFFAKYPSNSLASSCLYWIAESLYDMGYYTDALLLYNRVIEDYPTSPKREASTYRMALIEQRARENELLRLLKETHEAALRAADDFERKTRNYEQTIAANQKRIADLTKNTRYEDLEKEINRLMIENAALNSRVLSLESSAGVSPAVRSSEIPFSSGFDTPQSISDELKKLREKATTIQNTLESGQGGTK